MTRSRLDDGRAVDESACRGSARASVHRATRSFNFKANQKDESRRHYPPANGATSAPTASDTVAASAPTVSISTPFFSPPPSATVARKGPTTNNATPGAHRAPREG